MTKSIDFMSLFLLNETFKNKNHVEKNNHKSFEKVLLLLSRQSAPLSILT